MKKWLKILLLCAVLLALLGGYALVLNMNQRTQQAAEQDGSFALIDKAADTLAGLSWESGGETLSFSKSDEGWTNADDPDFPTDQAAMEDLEDRFISMEANRKITDVSDVSEYGIGETSFTVTAKWSDGSETRYVQGDATPFDDGYYLQSSDDAGTVYSSPNALDAIFAETKTDLAELEVIPTVENPTRLSVGGTLDVSRAEGEGRFDPEQQWYDTASGEAMDDAATEELLTTFNGLSWKQLLSVSATPEELSAWQLDDANAVAVSSSDGTNERSVLFGTSDESGDRYARLPDSDMVYTVASDTADALLNADVDSLRNMSLFPLDYEELKEFSTVSEGVERHFEIPETAANEEADEGDGTDTAEGTDAEADTQEEADTEEAPDADEVTDVTTASGSGYGAALAEEADDAAAATGDDTGDEASTVDVQEAEDSDATINQDTADTSETVGTDEIADPDDTTEEEPDAEARAIWSRIQALKGTERSDELPTGDALLSISATNRDGVSLSCQCYARDIDNYLAVLSDGRSVLVSGDEVDALIRALRA